MGWMEGARGIGATPWDGESCAWCGQARVWLEGPVLAFLVLLGAPTPGIAEEPFAACPDRNPQVVREVPRCYYQTARRTPASYAQAAAHLEKLLAQNPEDPWAALYLAHSTKEAGQERAADFYQQAIDGFLRLGETHGEFYARKGLWEFWVRRSEFGKAAEQVERVTEMLERTDDPRLHGRLKLLPAMHLSQTRGDFRKVRRAALLAEDLLFPDGVYQAKVDCLNYLGSSSLELGRADDALGYYERMGALAQEAGDILNTAQASAGTLDAFILLFKEEPTEEARRRTLQQARRALALAQQAQSGPLIASVSGSLAKIVGGREAGRHFARCVKVARQQELDLRVAECLSSWAVDLAARDPERARQLARQALRIAAETEDPRIVAYVRAELKRVSWRLAPPEKALADALQALDAIERLRARQTGSAGRAELFSEWVPEYQWLVGKLLARYRQKGAAADLEHAFGVNERLRSRVLLEALDAARASPAVPPELERRRAELLDEISRVQRRLLDPSLNEQARGRSEEELERLEMGEAEVRDEMVRSRPELAAFEQPEFAGLEAVRQELAPGEALLAFQTALWENVYDHFAGGSWVISVTRQRARVYPVRDSDRLRAALPVFLGLFEERSGNLGRPGARLYEILLGDALAELPPEVDRLVLVPDGILHNLPFSALRPAPEAPPLAARYQISRVPSATLWLRWRKSEPAPARRPALALADPELPSGPETVSTLVQGSDEVAMRGWSLTRGTRLTPLPHARREGRSLVRHLGPGVELLVGAEATEGFVKGASLGEFGLLHLAAHAVSDREVPERSAVFLAAGEGDGDGLLQFREIVGLDLSGRCVVLSACSTASGAVLRGEGVLDLARAFFQAGAHAVVGSLWPLRDDEAAAFFEVFYTHLGRGRSVGEALQEAQRALIETGAPPSTWAGLVVIGDSELVPWPHRRRAFWPLALGVGLLLVALVLAVRWHSGWPAGE